MAIVRNLARPATAWQPGGVPLTMMMNIERRKGKDVPVIRKTLVALDGKAFQEFKNRRADWQCASAYRYPGPIQYFGPPEVCDCIPQTLALEQQ
jgi:pyrophosphate--fructose-6-phosphate 1-phosphotransferase